MRKTHPADLADAQIIREAAFFQIALFLGRGEYARAEAPTFQAAQAAAASLEADHPGRRAMIYGVRADGRSALWTPNMENLIMETNEVIGKDYSAKSAALRALKRSGLDPDQAEVRIEGKRWVIRRPSDPRLDDAGEPANTESVKAARERADKTAGKLARRISPAAAQEAARADAIAARAEKRRDQTKAASAKRAAAAPKLREPKPAADGAPKARRNAAYEAALAEAQKGKLPSPPDFSAETHAPYRARLAKLIAMAKAGDLAGLRAENIKPYNSSMVPLGRFRDLCVIALESR